MAAAEGEAANPEGKGSMTESKGAVSVSLSAADVLSGEQLVELLTEASEALGELEEMMRSGGLTVIADHLATAKGEVSAATETLYETDPQKRGPLPVDLA